MGATISLERKKPKKHKDEAAHSICALCLLGSFCQIGRILSRILGVIGRRGRDLVLAERLIPFKTYILGEALGECWGSPSSEQSVQIL